MPAKKRGSKWGHTPSGKGRAIVHDGRLLMTKKRKAVVRAWGAIDMKKNLIPIATDDCSEIGRALWNVSHTVVPVLITEVKRACKRGSREGGA